MTESLPPPIHDAINMLERPTPVFAGITKDLLEYGIPESPTQTIASRTILDSFDVEAVLQRCQKAWGSSGTMTLLYRNTFGEPITVPIMAARPVIIQGRSKLELYVYLPIDSFNDY